MTRQLLLTRGEDVVRLQARIRREAADVAPDDVQVGATPEIKRQQVVGEDHAVGHFEITQFPTLDIDRGTEHMRAAVIELRHRHASEGYVRRHARRRVDVAVDDPLDIRVASTREEKRRHPQRRLAEEGDDDRDGRTINSQRPGPSYRPPTWPPVRATSGP